jgi:hypothetical protein
VNAELATSLLLAYILEGNSRGTTTLGVLDDRALRAAGVYLSA